MTEKNWDLGVTVILLEHYMSLAMKVSDSIVVLDQGGRLVPKDAP